MNRLSILAATIFVFLIFPHYGNAGFLFKKKKEREPSSSFHYIDTLAKPVNLDLKLLKEDLLTQTWVSLPILNVQHKKSKAFKCGEEDFYDPQYYLQAMQTYAIEVSKPLKSLTSYFSASLKTKFNQFQTAEELVKAHPYFYFQSEVLELVAKYWVPKEIDHFKQVILERAKDIEKELLFVESQLQTWMEMSHESKLESYLNQPANLKGLIGFEMQLLAESISITFPTFVSTDSNEKRTWEPGFGLHKAKKVTGFEEWMMNWKGYQLAAYKYLIYSSLQTHCKERNGIMKKIAKCAAGVKQCIFE